MSNMGSASNSGPASAAGPGSNAVGPVPETDVILQRVVGIIAGARALPLSSSVKLDNKDEVLDLLEEAIGRLPDELRQARWMLKEREEFLSGTQRRADELVESARSEAQRLVQRTEILKDAQAQARRVLEDAREEARRLRLEAEDYADQRLAQFEIILERTLKTVASGREKLAGLPGSERDHASAAPDVAGGLQGRGPAPVAEGPPARAAEGQPGHGAWYRRRPEVAPGDRREGPPAGGGRDEEGLFDQDSVD